jgi:hypothetical protein
VRIEPVSVERLVATLADRAAALDGRARVLVDGPAAAEPDALADALVDPLRTLGRPVVRATSRYFLRPASLRLERGRHDPDAYLDDWLDTGGLLRELLDPLGPNGSGRYLPTLWDPDTDRATRASYQDTPDRTVLLLDGPLLLGRGLPAELIVHLDMSPAALARRTTAAEHWTLPAFDRYRDETAPGRIADIVVRYDDPAHPALVSPSPGTPRAPR